MRVPAIFAVDDGLAIGGELWCAVDAFFGGQLRLLTRCQVKQLNAAHFLIVPGDVGERFAVWRKGRLKLKV